MSGNKKKNGEHWTVKKEISWPQIAGFAFQLLLLVVFVTKLDSRVTNSEDQIKTFSEQKLDGRITALESTSSQQSAIIEAQRNNAQAIQTTLARIQERQSIQTDDIKDIKDILKDATFATKQKH